MLINESLSLILEHLLIYQELTQCYLNKINKNEFKFHEDDFLNKIIVNDVFFVDLLKYYGKHTGLCKLLINYVNYNTKESDALLACEMGIRSHFKD